MGLVRGQEEKSASHYWSNHVCLRKFAMRRELQHFRKNSWPGLCSATHIRCLFRLESLLLQELQKIHVGAGTYQAMEQGLTAAKTDHRASNTVFLSFRDTSRDGFTLELLRAWSASTRIRHMIEISRLGGDICALKSGAQYSKRKKPPTNCVLRSCVRESRTMHKTFFHKTCRWRCDHQHGPSAESASFSLEKIDA